MPPAPARPCPPAAVQGGGELLQRDEPSQTEDEILAIIDAASAPGTAVGSGFYVRGAGRGGTLWAAGVWTLPVRC